MVKRERERERERELPIRETWWQNEKVQAEITLKRERYRSLPRCRDIVAYENYRDKQGSKKDSPRG